MFDNAYSEQQNVSSYKNYPIDRPFVNTIWKRPSRSLSKAYPESNRDVIMSSLKKLQEKINHLELQSEKGFAKNDTHQHQQEQEQQHQSDDLENQSIETENKVYHLEKQLERMRKMVNEQERLNYDDWTNSTRRLKNLEKESMILDADFNGFQSCFDTSHATIPFQAPSLPPQVIRAKRSPSRKSTQRSKSACKRSQSSLDMNSRLTGSHYRLNLGDIPFVVGKSTAPSHHLGTNVQNVISMLKQHHPKLCNSVAHCSLTAKPSKTFESKRGKGRRSSSVPPADEKDSESSSGPAAAKVAPQRNLIDLLTENELREFLRQLQEEYTKLVLAHYDITKRIMICDDDTMRHDLELKAANLDKKMKSKAKQITKLKTHRRKNKTRSKSTLANKNSKPQIANKSSTKKENTNLVQTSLDGNHLKCLKFFKDIKHLQNQIQNDQILFN